MKGKRKIVTRILSVLLAVIVGASFSMTIPQKTFAATKAPAKVKIISVKSDYENGGVIVKWKKLKNVQGYDIYYSKTKNGKYQYVGWGSKYDNKASVNSTSLDPGKKYYFKVRAYNKTKEGKFSAPKRAKVVTGRSGIESVSLKTPTSVSLNLNNNWYCDGVEIYRSYKGGKYTKIKTLTKGKNGIKSSYVDTKRSAGKYSYKMKSYTKVGKKKIYSKYSTAKSIIVPKKITISMNNWQKYFEIVEKQIPSKDAFGKITAIDYNQYLQLKPQYKAQEAIYTNSKTYESNIAYDITYTREERNFVADWSSGKITIGDLRTPEYEDETVTETGNEIGELSGVSPYIGNDKNGNAKYGDYTVQAQVNYDYILRDSSYIYFGTNFKINRIQGTLYLTKW